MPLHMLSGECHQVIFSGTWFPLSSSQMQSGLVGHKSLVHLSTLSWYSAMSFPGEIFPGIRNSLFLKGAHFSSGKFHIQSKMLLLCSWQPVLESVGWKHSFLCWLSPPPGQPMPVLLSLSLLPSLCFSGFKLSLDWKFLVIIWLCIAGSDFQL